MPECSPGAWYPLCVQRAESDCEFCISSTLARTWVGLDSLLHQSCFFGSGQAIFLIRGLAVCSLKILICNFRCSVPSVSKQFLIDVIQYVPSQAKLHGFAFGSKDSVVSEPPTFLTGEKRSDLIGGIHQTCLPGWPVRFEGNKLAIVTVHISISSVQLCHASSFFPVSRSDPGFCCRICSLSFCPFLMHGFHGTVLIWAICFPMKANGDLSLLNAGT